MVELLVVLGIAGVAGGGLALAVRRGLAQHRDRAMAQVARFRSMSRESIEVADQVEMRADAMARRLGGQSAEQLTQARTAFDASRGRADQAVAHHRTVDASTLADAPKAAVRQVELASISGVDDLNELGTASVALEKVLSELEARRQQIIDAALELGQHRDRLAKALAGAESAGWRTASMAPNVEQIDEWLEAADPTAPRLDMAHAEEAMALARPGLGEAIEWAETLPQRAEATRAELSELRAEAAHHTSRAAEYEAIARRWETEHGAGDIDDLSEHVASALSLCGQVEAAAAPLDAEDGPMAKGNQDWARADSLMAEVRHTVQRARDLLVEVDDREAELLTLRDELVGVVAGAREDLDDLAAFLQAEQGNVSDSFHVTLDLGSSLVGQAEAELAKARPEYLQAAAMATDAAEHLDVALEKAHESKREIGARRAAARRAIMNAHSAVGRLESYHRSSFFAVLNRWNGEVEDLVARAARLTDDDAQTQSRAEELARQADLLRTQIEANRKSEGSIRFDQW